MVRKTRFFEKHCPFLSFLFDEGSGIDGPFSSPPGAYAHWFPYCPYCLLLLKTRNIFSSGYVNNISDLFGKKS